MHLMYCESLTVLMASQFRTTEGTHHPATEAAKRHLLNPTVALKPAQTPQSAPPPTAAGCAVAALVAAAGAAAVAAAAVAVAGGAAAAGHAAATDRAMV